MLRLSTYLLPMLLLGCGDEELEKLLADRTNDVDLDGVTAEEGDCDDTLASINPYSSDNVGDDVDQNCDGLDGVDADADGLASVESGGADCDDQDARPSIPQLADRPRRSLGVGVPA